MTALLSLRDRRLLAALQCDGRVSAERAGAVLGLSAPTVRRRWSEMQRTGVVRIVAAPARGWAPATVIVRFRTAGADQRALAGRILAREGVHQVDVAVRDEDLTVVLGAAADPAPLVRELRTRGVVTDVVTSTVLRAHASPWQWRLGVLDDDERAHLTAIPTGPDVRSDEVDARLLALLRHDGRMPAAALAHRLGMSESAARRRVRHLTASGLLHTRAVFDPAVVGLPLGARLWARVSPARLGDTGRALTAHPAVLAAHVTTGSANVQLGVRAPDVEALYSFIADDLGSLGVELVESTIVRSVEAGGATPR